MALKTRLIVRVKTSNDTKSNEVPTMAVAGFSCPVCVLIVKIPLMCFRRQNGLLNCLSNINQQY